MVITVIGLGFVGLTSSLGFAHYGHTVFGVESSQDRLKKIQGGDIPFLEPGLPEALQQHLNRDFHPVPADRLSEAVGKSDVVYFCVGTPAGQNGKADLTFLKNAYRQVICAIADSRPRVLVTKSTVPPGTLEQEIRPLAEKEGSGKNIHLAANPEFLREGHCWDDFINADRIVIGTDSEAAKKILAELYAPCPAPIHFVSPTTAEYIKYLSNALLATMISFANETAKIGTAIGGIQIPEAFRILHEDRRWSMNAMKSYVYPGCGFGGYCLPKDIAALAARGKEAGCATPLLDQVTQVNHEMPAFHAGRILAEIRKQKAAVLGILGLSFKPGSDDVRDTPAAKVIRILQDSGEKISIIAYDPAAGGEFARAYPELQVKYASSAGEVIRESDLLAILTAWPDFTHLKSKTGKTVIDCRYCLSDDNQ